VRHANANVDSGKSAMSVPSPRMPKPNHTQLMSGFTTISMLAVCALASNCGITR
jgi:hypothetical protein